MNPSRTHDRHRVGVLAARRWIGVLAGASLAVAVAIVGWPSSLGVRTSGVRPGKQGAVATGQPARQALGGTRAAAVTEQLSQAKPAPHRRQWAELDRQRLEHDWDLYCRANPRREWRRPGVWEYLWPTDEEVLAHRPRGGDPAAEIEKTLALVREALSTDAVPDQAIRSTKVIPMDDWHNDSDFVACSFEVGDRLFRVVRGYVLSIAVIPPDAAEQTEDPLGLVVDVCREWGTSGDGVKPRLRARGAAPCEGSPLTVGYVGLTDEKPWEQANDLWCGASFVTDGRVVVVRIPIEQKRDTLGRSGENSAMTATGPVHRATDPYVPPEPLDWF